MGAIMEEEKDKQDDKEQNSEKKVFSTEEFLNVFLTNTDIQNEVNATELQQGDASIDDVIKGNQRFSEALNRAEQKLDSHQMDDLTREARLRISRVAVSNRKKKSSKNDDEENEQDSEDNRSKNRWRRKKTKAKKPKKRFWDRFKRKGAKTAGKDIGKAAGKKVARKSLVKGTTKTVLKKIPGVSAVAGLAFGVGRLMDGDYVGAAGEVASGVAGCFPGIGTGISCAVDAALIAKDVAAPQTDDVAASDGEAEQSVSQEENSSKKSLSREEYNLLMTKRGILDNKAPAPVKQTQINQQMLQTSQQLGGNGM